MFSFTLGATTAIRFISSSQKNLSAILMMPFVPSLLALEVEADGDIVAHVFQSEQGDYGKQSLGGYMVYYSAVFQEQQPAIPVSFRLTS